MTPVFYLLRSYQINNYEVDLIMSIFAFLALAFYSVLAFKKFYGINIYVSAITGLVFSFLLMFFIFYVYRYILFFTVISLI